MTTFPIEIQNILDTSICELFKTNGVSDAQLTSDTALEIDNCDFCGIIGFSGAQMKGNLLIASTKELLDHTHPSKAMGMDVGEEDLADWIGEIANQTVGRLKNSLLKFSVNVAITTPTVLSGKQITAYTMKDNTIRKTLNFKMDQFSLSLTAHIELLDKIDFSRVEDSSKTEDEGSSLFF